MLNNIRAHHAKRKEMTTCASVNAIGGLSVRVYEIDSASIKVERGTSYKCKHFHTDTMHL